VLRFDDEIEVRLGVARVGRTSITYTWEIARDGEKAVEGRHTVVNVNRAGRAEPLSDELRANLSS
jgi:acyl-CoA thioesterase FadM